MKWLKMAVDPAQSMDTGSPLKNPVYLKLFLAQVIALTGTGLSTIALALLAYNLSEANAGTVLGVALALKMVAYVVIAPAVGGLTHLLPRKSLMIAMDLLRAILVLFLPFVETVWQIYLLVFLINAASAAFKPLYQAIIPDVLPDERQYTKALSLFRMAYDMENILSPSLAALLLTVWSFDSLFLLNGGAFLLSGVLLVITVVPKPPPSDRTEKVVDNLLFGVRAYLATPQLRGLLVLYVAVASASSMVIVNTVVYVRVHLGGSDIETAQAMLAAGAGSVVAAFFLPHLLARVTDRTVMISGAGMLGMVLGLGMTAPGLLGLLGLWFWMGVGLSIVQTPSGRLITAACHPGDRTAFFSANFALSHGCWFFGYLLAGYLGAGLGLTSTFAILAVVVMLATLTALWMWPVKTAHALPHHHDTMEHVHAHVHDEHHKHEHLPEEKPVEDDHASHLHSHVHASIRHQHPFVIDLHHPKWPKTQ